MQSLVPSPSRKLEKDTKLVIPMKNRAIIAILIAIHAPAQAAIITFGMETDLSVSSTAGDLAGATAALGLGNSGQEGSNYSITFSDGDNATITRLNTSITPIAAIASNGLGGETGRTLLPASADASLFTVTLTTSSTGVSFDSLSWALASSNSRQHRFALYDSSFAQIGSTQQTIGGTNTITVNGGATETDGSGSFDGLIAPNSTAVFYLDTGFNLSGGVGTIVTDSISLNITAVPEPSVAASFALLSASVLLRRRRSLNR
jgi:hypothetical protein